MLKKQDEEKAKIKKFKENVSTIIFICAKLYLIEFMIIKIENQINDFLKEDTKKKLTLQPMDKVHRSVV